MPGIGPSPNFGNAPRTTGAALVRLLGMARSMFGRSSGRARACARALLLPAAILSVPLPAAATEGPASDEVRHRGSRGAREPVHRHREDDRRGHRGARGRRRGQHLPRRHAPVRHDRLEPRDDERVHARAQPGGQLRLRRHVDPRLQPHAPLRPRLSGLREHPVSAGGRAGHPLARDQPRRLPGDVHARARAGVTRRVRGRSALVRDPGRPGGDPPDRPRPVHVSGGRRRDDPRRHRRERRGPHRQGELRRSGRDRRPRSDHRLRDRRQVLQHPGSLHGLLRRRVRSPVRAVRDLERRHA